MACLDVSKPTTKIMSKMSQIQIFPMRNKQGNNVSSHTTLSLQVWTSFVDFLVGVVESKSAGAELVKSKYREALTSLVAEVLKKLQFRFNAGTLQKMDDETFDDDVSEPFSPFALVSIEC